MSEPARIAEKLSRDTDLAAAGLLFAIYLDQAPEPSREDAHLWEQLIREGCVDRGLVTPLGAKVAIRLEAAGLFGDRPDKFP